VSSVSRDVEGRREEQSERLELKGRGKSSCKQGAVVSTVSERERERERGAERRENGKSESIVVDVSFHDIIISIGGVGTAAAYSTDSFSC
jgi:hypothetical protein